LGSNPARVHFGPGGKQEQANYFAGMKLGLLRLWILELKEKEGRDTKDIHTWVEQKIVLIFNASR
jgi:hypothetical protein